MRVYFFFFFFSSRRRHTRSLRDWSSDVCSSDLFHQGSHVRRVDPKKRQRGGIRRRAIVRDGIGAGCARYPFGIVDKKVVHLRGGIHVIFAKEDALRDPVDQTVGEHQIVHQIRTTVEGLSEILTPVALGVNQRERIAGGIGKQWCYRSSGWQSSERCVLIDEGV